MKVHARYGLNALIPIAAVLNQIDDHDKKNKTLRYTLLFMLSNSNTMDVRLKVSKEPEHVKTRSASPTHIFDETIRMCETNDNSPV